MLKPGTLWARVQTKTGRALQSGALQPIQTEIDFVKQGGVRFLVRIVSNLARKEAATGERATEKQEEAGTADEESSPFLPPYEEDLFVADISPTHVCLLNKFNVFKHHLLVVTRSFEDQETWLTLSDFEALWACMAEFDGLAFYNAGPVAGASQTHKHLQLVPFPLAPRGPDVPLEPLLASNEPWPTVGTISDLPFAHAFIWPDGHLQADSPAEAAEMTFAHYKTMLRHAGLVNGPVVAGGKQSNAYNLLLTRQWMLLVPRSQECFDSISINALGFAGALLVQDEAQKKMLQDHGPMTALKTVAVTL
jgi:ATP adenylyltransferase